MWFTIDSSEGFVRALALSALVRYGDEPLLSGVEHEIEQAKNGIEAGA